MSTKAGQVQELSERLCVAEPSVVVTLRGSWLVAEDVSHTMLHALSGKDEKQVTNNLRSIREQLSASCEVQKWSMTKCHTPAIFHCLRAIEL